MARQQLGLRPPAAGDAEAVAVTGHQNTLYRACAEHHEQPWWFSSRDDTTSPGRFDLTTPFGTCYWAATIAGAILEATSDPDVEESTVITPAALNRLRVWAADEVEQAHDQLADTTVASVPRLTGEIATVVPYDLPWQWADAFHDVGRAGVRFRGRFAQDVCVALFDTSGIPPVSPGHRAVGTGLEHLEALPGGFRPVVSTVGTLSSLPRAEEP